MNSTGGNGRPGRPARLSRERIVEAALQGDVATLTMRELATRLGVSHSSLYRWVPDRDGVLDLVSGVMVERVLPEDEPDAENWRDWLTRLAWAMHDEFLAVPGYAAHVARPHRHHPESFGRLRGRAVAAFRAGGADARQAEQNWTVFGHGVVRWLAAAGSHPAEPPFGRYLDTLLRGLPHHAEERPPSLRPEAAAQTAATASPSIGDEHLLALARGLASESAKVRERACETICDWVRSFDRREVRTLASLLASAAVLEQDETCLESELNALGELSVTGLFDAADIATLRSLPRDSVRPADVEHLDNLMEEYF
ncbi:MULTISPECIES: TetR/AcrR family transcriptional regulator [unclassified Streptomyces]|uniref:TetR/AcrR family transcriptional regulator n=1 Tax=unclassified Streptomyces TaxID=2593676 RepID=UPI000B503FB7|nr:MULTISPECIES: TetR/AcrR family transcriptional regulator [unclassified Streptomyces]MYX05087.1 TetR/AcrR family transcriptional regulator [Streptomyces sp. SID8378]SNB89981.1 transcriptional regulator, TetR family [Streptomyces sp. PgraA7]